MADDQSFSHPRVGNQIAWPKHGHVDKDSGTDAGDEHVQQLASIQCCVHGSDAESSGEMASLPQMHNMYDLQS